MDTVPAELGSIAVWIIITLFGLSSGVIAWLLNDRRRLIRDCRESREALIKEKDERLDDEKKLVQIIKLVEAKTND